MIAQSPDRRILPPRPWVILLVDDESDVLRSVADLLERSLAGVRVLQARSGRQGLELLDGERVDAIIADFKMTGMDGIEFLYIARSRRPGIPRVMLTAFANDPAVRQAAEGVEVQALLSKATGPAEFVEQVALLLAYEPAIRPEP